MKLKCPKNCHKCCELVVYVKLKDIEKWLDEDRLDIISTLTWYTVWGTYPPHRLIIPKKKHLKSHSFLNIFYKKEYENSNECIFLSDGRCTIYKVRPEACMTFPRGNLRFNCPGLSDVTDKDREEEKLIIRNMKVSNLLVYKHRELISKVINMAKERVSLEELRRIIR